MLSLERYALSCVRLKLIFLLCHMFKSNVLSRGIFLVNPDCGVASHFVILLQDIVNSLGSFVQSLFLTGNSSVNSTVGTSVPTTTAQTQGTSL